MTLPLIVSRPEGLYCPEGEFFIDPWRPVNRAVITHAHSDHARRGNAYYLAHRDSAQLLYIRLGADISLQTLDYGETLEHRGVRISLHPAGHVLGSAQVRLECKGRVWVASGDYKLADDGTCRPFEPVRCDTFITESTFGLPVYRWPHQADLFADINNWWQRNAASGRASILFCYAFGKAQRILRGVDSTIGPIVCHGAVEPLNVVYRATGVPLPVTFRVTDETMNKSALSQALVLAPPSAAGTPWLRRFGEYSDAFASGWMQVRGARRRRGVDRGFVMSDHADWPALHRAIGGTQAGQVFVTHGSIAIMVRYLREQGLDAQAFATEYGGEEEADSAHGEAVPMPGTRDSLHTSDAAFPVGTDRDGPRESDHSGASGFSPTLSAAPRPRPLES